jgi:AraC-like DNA-binding protein
VVDDGRSRRLQQHARHLGYSDLRGYLQARCDAGYSLPALAHELGESEWTVTKALATQPITLPARPQRLARQRRRFAQQRIAKLVADLGFPDVRAYLADRLIGREWLLAEVAAELGAHRATVRRLMQQSGVQRHRRTARQVAAGRRGELAPVR